MNFPINKNTISLAVVTVILLLFFVAGAFDVLDYVIIKILLIGLTSVVAIVIAANFFKNSLKKNRPEDKLQDDSN